MLIHVADQKGWGDFLSLINMRRSLKVRGEKGKQRRRGRKPQQMCTREVTG